MPKFGQWNRLRDVMRGFDKRLKANCRLALMRAGDGVIVPNATKSGTHDEKKHRITVDGEQKYVIEIERRRLDEYVG